MTVPNFVAVLVPRLRMIADGLATLYQIPAAVLPAQGSGLKAKAAAQDPLLLRRGLRFVRAFLPNLRVSWK
jgi:hypothetical protein